MGGGGGRPDLPGELQLVETEDEELVMMMMMMMRGAMRTYHKAKYLLADLDANERGVNVGE